MKFNVKKSIVAMVALGISGAASAYYLPNTHHLAQNKFFFGAEGLYLQPGAHDLNYATTLSTDGKTTKVHSLDPDYEFGFSLWAGYHLINHNDITVNWTHLFEADDSETLHTPSSVRWQNEGVGFDNVKGKAQFDFDNIYGVYGHTFYAHHWSLRLGAGVQYVDLSQDLKVSGNGTGSNEDPISFNNKSESSFDGVGPRVEMDVLYPMRNGFGLTGHLATAMLIGKQESDLNLEQTQSNVVSKAEIDTSKPERVVPMVGAKAGINWTHNFGSTGPEGAFTMGPILTIEAGWQAESYIDAIDQFGRDNSIQDHPLNHKTTSFTLQGPYLGFQLNL